MSKSPYPSYTAHIQSGELRRRAEKARKVLSPCTVCPRNCHVDRISGETGICRTGKHATVSSALPHHGEEPGLSGSRGAGTIFFGGCNLKCIFCQNYQISQEEDSPPVDANRLADMMLDLQERGCHNIDLVSPTHVGPQILEAVAIAAERGLSIPLLYNSNGYDSVDMLRLFDGVVDIYLPDLKYGYDEAAQELSGVKDYTTHAHAALKEMYRQVGDVVFDDTGVVRRGLIVRLLVLPDDLAGMYESLSFIADELSTDVWLSIMSQYYPTYKARNHGRMNRSITGEEYRTVLEWGDRLGFENYWAQGHASVDVFRPDFRRDDVFEGNNPADE